MRRRAARLNDLLDIRALFRKITEDRLIAFMSFTFPALIYCLTLNSAGGQAQNIVSMQSSLIQEHSATVFPPGMDTIQFQGNYYNVYAPGLAFISLPFASLGFLTYSAFNGYVGNAILMDEIFLALCASLSGYIVFKISQQFTRFAYASLLASFALTLGSSVWPYAVSVFPHDTSLMFSLVSVYSILRFSKSQSSSVFLPLVAGVFLGAAALVEYAVALFALPLILYLASEKQSHANLRAKSILSFGTAFAILGIGLNLLYNYSVLGSPLAFPQLLSGAGAHFLLNEFLLEHMTYYLVSPFRGIFFLCPVLILGAFGLREMWKSYRSESVLFITLFAFTLVYYSAWQGWDGAWAFGPRFLIIGLPYLAIPIAVLLTQNRVWYKPFLALFTVSSFVQGVGAVAGASAPGRNSPLLFQPLAYSIPQVLSGNTLVVWMHGLGYPEIITGTLLVLFIIWLVAVEVASVAMRKFGALEWQRKIEIPLEVPG